MSVETKPTPQNMDLDEKYKDFDFAHCHLPREKQIQYLELGNKLNQFGLTPEELEVYNTLEQESNKNMHDKREEWKREEGDTSKGI